MLKHRLFAPVSLPAGSFAPLVVALHGCTQTASDFAAGTQFDRVAERAGAFVLYPEQSVLANPQRCWNWFLPENQFRESGEPAAILLQVEETCARYRIDRERIFVTGLSAGGAMAAILAEQAPDVFAAVGIMAGVALHASHDVESAHTAMHRAVTERDIVPIVARRGRRIPGYKRLRATIWSGAQDKLVAPENSSVLAHQFLRLLDLDGRRPAIQERDGVQIARWSDAAGRVRVEAWRIADMGHAWSGGSFSGSHTYPPGPAASDAMMGFFLEEPEFAPANRGHGSGAAS